MEAIFGGAMVIGGVSSIIASIYYWVMIGVKKRKEKTFQMILISLLLACEVGSILSSFLQFSVPDDPNKVFCSVGQGLFLVFSYSSFFLTSLLVLSLLHLAFVGTRIPPPYILLRLSTERKLQVISSLVCAALVVLFVVLWILVLIGNWDFCEGSAAGFWIYWGLWLLTTSFNFISLAFIVYNIHKITKKTKQDKRAVRSVLSVSLILGLLRFPAFLIGIIGRPPNEVLGEGVTPLGIGVVIAFFLNVSQATFVVIFVGASQGLFNWCCCCSSSSSERESSNSNASPSSPQSLPKSRSMASMGLAHEEMTLDMKTPGPE